MNAILAILAAAVAPLMQLDGNNMILVEAKADGRPCTLILDTGATHTTLDSGFVAKNLPKKELSPVTIMGDTNVDEAPKCLELETLEIGEARFEGEQVMAIGLSHLSGTVGRKIDGILGMSTILRRRALLRASEGEILFAPDAKDCEGFGAPCRSITKDPLEIVVLAGKDGKRCPMLLDSASTWTILPTGFAGAGNAERGAGNGEVEAVGVNGKVEGGESSFAKGVELYIGGEVVADAMINDSLAPRIGADLLRRYDALLDVGVLRLRPAGNR